MNLLEATYVQLRGVTNIAGRAASNLDAARDGCVLHLHEETGGVFVTYGVSDHADGTQDAHSHYIAGMSVESVDLKEAIVASVRWSNIMAPPSFAPQIAQAELDEKMNAGARKSPTLADEVLAEFQDADAKPNPKRARKSLRHSGT